MLVNVNEKPTNFVIFEFFGRNFRHLLHTPPPLHHNCRTIEFAILRLHQTFLQIFNSQKCWTKTLYPKFKGPAIAMGEIGWRKLRLKKSNWPIQFFQPWFSSPKSPLPQSQSQDSRFCDIVSSSNIFENLHNAIARPTNLRYCVFFKQFWEFKILKTVDGGNWVTKITAKKMENVSSIFSVAIFVTRPPTHSPLPIAIITELSMVDENSAIAPKESKTLSVWFFSAVIFITPHYNCDIESSSNIFENLLIAISNLRALRL